MNRSGNPLLDSKLEEFTEEMIKTMIAHKHKHNTQNDITVHNNTPSSSAHLQSLVNHLNSEIKEYENLFILRDDINDIESRRMLKKELLDMSNMCFLIHWYLKEMDEANED